MTGICASCVHSLVPYNLIITYVKYNRDCGKLPFRDIIFQYIAQPRGVYILIIIKIIFLIKLIVRGEKNERDARSVKEEKKYSMGQIF